MLGWESGMVGVLWRCEFVRKRSFERVNFVVIDVR